MRPLIRFILLGLALSGLASARAAEAPVFALTAADVPKVVVLLFKPDKAVLEITYSKEKQAELAALTAGGLPKQVIIALAGREIAERTMTAPATGHSLKIEVASPDEAFALARALFQPSAGTEKP